MCVCVEGRETDEMEKSLCMADDSVGKQLIWKLVQKSEHVIDKMDLCNHGSNFPADYHNSCGIKRVCSNTGHI